MKRKVFAVPLSIMLLSVILLNVLIHGANIVSWAAAPYDDEFNTASLNTRWSWLNEDPSRWSLSTSPGNLRIIATRGDMFSTVCGSLQAKNVLLQQAPMGDFAIETKLSILTAANYQQAGLLVFKDTNTYFKIGPAYSQEEWGGQGLQAVLITNGEIAVRFAFHVDLVSSIYLRLTKQDDTYLGHYSLDGQTWMLIGQVQTNAINDPKIGIFAKTSCPPNNVPDVAADFDYFRTYSTFKAFLPMVRASDIMSTIYRSPVRGNVRIGVYRPGIEDHTGRDKYAVDYLSSEDDTIYPTLPGEVVFAAWNCDTVSKQPPCYGNVVAIRHADGIYSIYAHLKAEGLPTVGRKVDTNTAIGKMSNSGCEGCGVHLHFAVRKGNSGLTGPAALWESNEPVDVWQQIPELIDCFESKEVCQTVGL